MASSRAGLSAPQSHPETRCDGSQTSETIAYRLDADARVWIEQTARNAGFDLAGVAPVPDSGSSEAEAQDARFADWIAAGHAGEMEWLKRSDTAGSLLRGDLRRAMPWARSVVVCALNYNADAPRSIDPAPPSAGWIARYAWSGKPGAAPEAGADYHDVLLERLKVIASALGERFPGCIVRPYVDTGPILERGYAASAGIGWIGKNTCVLSQKLGSWLLLGVLVTSLELTPEAAPTPASDRCGSCTRCIDACPTDALFLPTAEQPTRGMDASRCISYLTIEKKGAIPDDLRGAMGRHVFGCDICQDVCPWNRRAPAAATPMMPPRRALINPELAWLASLDGPAFNRWFRGSPLERTRRKRVLRNVAIAMGNSGERSFLRQLAQWAAGDDAVLAEAAQWAMARLNQEPP